MSKHKLIKTIEENVLDHISKEVEKRCEAWISSAHGIDFAKKLSDVLKQNAKLQEQNRAMREALEEIKKRYSYGAFQCLTIARECFDKFTEEDV